MKKTITLCLFVFFHIYLFAQQPFSSTLILEKGDSLQQEKKYAEAIDLYKQIYVNDSNYYRGLYEISSTYYADSQFTKALEVSSFALTTLNEERPSFYNLHANILDDMGQWQRAVIYYDSAIQIYPHYLSPYLNKATLLIRQKNYSAAEQLLQRAAFIFPYSSSVHYKLGLAAINQGKIIQSFLSLTHSLLVEPSNGNTKNTVSILSALSKADDEMLGYYQSRNDQPDENYQQTEQLFLSKLALDKTYKPDTELEDPITSQLQLIIEKLEFTSDDKDFYVQYYLPVLKQLLKEKKYNAYCNHIFSGLKIKQIEEYTKRNKKEITQMIDACIVYFNKVRISREFFAEKRTADGPYHYENGVCFAKGTYINEKALGPWEFYFNNGNPRSKGSFTDAGERTGQWIYFHENTLVSGKENYVNGKMDGEELVMSATGTRTRVAGFTDGKKTGENHAYYTNGNLSSIETFDDGKESGLLKYYYNEGPLRAEVEAKNGTNNGKLQRFYLNGHTELVQSYSEGKLQGNSITWFDNGVKAGEGLYEGNQPAGNWKYYHENGNIKTEVTYINGEAEGESIEYHDNGTISHKVIYKKGKADGEIIYYSREGKAFCKMSYNNGKVKDAIYFDSTGKQIYRSEIRGKSFQLETFRPDGSRKSRGSYNEKGTAHGAEITYWPSGARYAEMNYVNGAFHGVGTFYFTNGNKEQELNYHEGVKTGLFREYYKHGALLIEGLYKEDQYNGLWISYFHSAIPERKTFYVNGEKNGKRETYYPNGTLETIEEFGNGSLLSFIQFDTAGKTLVSQRFDKGSGKFITRNLNGTPGAEGTLLNGYLHGVYQSKFFDGKIRSKEFYYHGLPDSNYQLYFHNGNVQQEGKYFRGEKTGNWKYYYESGQLFLSEEWEKGKLHGTRTYYHENGKTETEMPFFYDKKEGWCNRYNEEGLLVNKIRYAEGIPVEYSYEDKNGNMVQPIPLPGGNGKMKSFYRNGNPSATLTYVDGDLNGPAAYYYSNGKPSWQGTESFNLTEGTATSFYPDGSVKSKSQFLHNTNHGLFQSFHKNGMIREEGNYHYDLKHGEWKTFDDNGVLKECRTYYFDRLIQCK